MVWLVAAGAVPEEAVEEVVEDSEAAAVEEKACATCTGECTEDELPLVLPGEPLFPGLPGSSEMEIEMERASSVQVLSLFSAAVSLACSALGRSNLIFSALCGMSLCRLR